MEKRYIADVIRALGLLGCTGIIALKVGKSHHVSAFRPDQTHVYLHEVQDAEKLILALARERAGVA